MIGLTAILQLLAAVLAFGICVGIGIGIGVAHVWRWGRLWRLVERSDERVAQTVGQIEVARQTGILAERTTLQEAERGKLKIPLRRPATPTANQAPEDAPGTFQMHEAAIQRGIEAITAAAKAEGIHLSPDAARAEAERMLADAGLGG